MIQYAHDLNDEQIATKMGIVPSTLYEWKKKYPEISEALKRGKEVVQHPRYTQGICTMD